MENKSHTDANQIATFFADWNNLTTDQKIAALAPSTEKQAAAERRQQMANAKGGR